MRRQRQRLLQASRTHSARLSDQLLVSNPYPQTCPFLPCPASRTYPCSCLSSSRSDVGVGVARGPSYRDRKSAVSGKSESVRVDPGGSRSMKKTTTIAKLKNENRDN